MIEIVDFFKIMADETRLRILMLLAQSDLFVCQIMGVLNLPQSKVSKHLAKLRDLKLVSIEKKEKYVLYKLDIGDELFKKMIEDILLKSDSFKVLKADSVNLKHKDSFLCDCSNLY